MLCNYGGVHCCEVGVYVLFRDGVCICVDLNFGFVHSSTFVMYPILMS